MKPDFQLHSLGTLDLMQLLHEHHLHGFQKLRWMSYMAPKGIYLRCHIAHKKRIYANIYLSSDAQSNMECHTSVGQLTSSLQDTRGHHALLRKICI